MVFVNVSVLLMVTLPFNRALTRACIFIYKYKRTGIHMMNILIIDDHPVVLDGTKTLLQDLANVHIETEQDSAAVLSRMDTDTFSYFSLISI